MDAGAVVGALAFGDDLRIVEANATAAAWLGRAPEALIGTEIHTILSPAARIFFNTQVHPSLALLGHVEELYLELVGNDGAPIPVVLSGRRERVDGEMCSMLVFLPMRRRQVYESELIAAAEAAERAARLEREANAQLANAHAQLAMRERLAALGTLAHGIAHEINNPLFYVITNLELLKAALPPNLPGLDDAHALVTDALEGATRIRDIARQMSSMLRADEAALTRVSLPEVVNIVTRMTTGQTRSRARLVVANGAVPEVEAHAGRLGQVLVNLIVNAAQAFGDRPTAGNEIRLSTRTTPEGHAEIEVADNGPGIPPEVIGRVFEPFFTTKPAGEGSGLGLSISLGLVQSCGGTLSVASEVGTGTRFWIRLPPAPAA